MKLLVVGDFHGKFPKKIRSIIHKEKIDLLVSNGDHFPFHFRKLWFKYCYGQDVELWEIIGKKKYKKLILKDLRLGDKVLKNMNKLPVPVILVAGNIDYTNHNDVSDRRLRKKNKRYFERDDQDFFSEIIKKYKNIKRFDYSFIKLGDFIFIGMSGSSFPGHVKSKAYKKSRKTLEKLFNKFRKENKKRRVIFVSHNIPYNTKLDKITSKDAHKLVRGEHYGSKLARRIIDKYHPILALGGHIHESRGKQKLGKTLVINPGAIHEGHYAIVEIDKDNPKKFRVKLR